MNFKVAGSANSRDYIAAGRAGAKGVRNAFIAARKSAPDYGGIGETAMSARSAERRAATKAEADVAKTGLAAMEYTKRAEIKADTKKYLADQKAGATRMAGIVGGLGAIAGGAFMGIENRREKKAQAERDRLEQERWDQRIDAITKHNDRPGYVAPEPLPLPQTTEDLEKPEFQVAPSLNDPQPSEEPQPKQVPAQNLSSSDSGVQQLAQSNDKSKLFQEIKSIAQEVGGAQFPGLVAAKAMHETGFMNPELDSVYNATGGTNLFGQKGDRGYGTTEDGFTLYPDRKTAVKDHITLWHDTKNHPENYNAFSTIDQGLQAVLPAYSPNSDPQNVKRGFTENAYGNSVRSILQQYN